jgi:hypothetical protein
MIPSGIELMPFRFVAQNLNHCATARIFIAGTLVWFGRYRVLSHVLTVSFPLWKNACGHCHLQIVTDIYTRLTELLFKLQRRENGFQERTLRSRPTVFTIHHPHTTRHDTRSKEWKPKETFEKLCPLKSVPYTRCKSKGLKITSDHKHFEEQRVVPG